MSATAIDHDDVGANVPSWKLLLTLGLGGAASGLLIVISSGSPPEPR